MEWINQVDVRELMSELGVDYVKWRNYTKIKTFVVKIPASIQHFFTISKKLNKVIHSLRIILLWRFNISILKYRKYGLGRMSRNIGSTAANILTIFFRQLPTIWRRQSANWFMIFVVVLEIAQLFHR